MTEPDQKVEKTTESSTSENHALDIGYYIASIVIIFGVLLVLYGLLGPTTQDDRSLGINLNLWWGAFMVLFGLICLGISYIATGKRASDGGKG